MTTLEKVKEHVDALQKLLKDPQPGLMVWVKMYGEHMQALEDIWNEKDDKPTKCAKCGSTKIYLESAAEGYSCPDCGSSDSDE